MALKKAEIEKFRKILEKMRAQILQTLKGSKEEVTAPDESGAYSQHQADKGTDDFGKVISLEVTSQEYAILKLIDRALEKMKENTYGVCDLTGKEIPIARLEAIPYATMTVEAQEKLEKGLL